MKAGLAELEHWIYEAGEEVLWPTFSSSTGSVRWRWDGILDFNVFTLDLFGGFVEC